jgi:hypothetical protein
MSNKLKNDTNNSSCLLSHIVVGLSVIVFYKLAKYFKITDKLNKNYNYANTNTTNGNINNTFTNKEQFTDSVTQSINDFISGANTEIINSQQAVSLTPAQLHLYSNKLDSLITNITNLQNTINTPNTSDNTNPANLSTLDLASQQQYQMFQIDYLNKQIKNAQDVINAQAISESSTNYKPIKVFSSCVVSNANGSTTRESPVNAPGSSRSSGLGGLQTSSDSQSGTAQQMLNTISQSNSQTSGPQLSSQTGVFQSMFTNLPKFNGINISE